ncbi:MAG TPA: hypothetical protein VG939_05775 [Caulobacteraceae bacterium]|nr:hypothetical protein [Caulobacteraceae bacterium]
MDYAGLQTAVGAYLNRGDLYQLVPTFIALAEAQLSRDLRHPRMVGRAVATLGAEFEALPTDFAELISVTLAATGETLDGLSVEAIADRRARLGSPAGRPDSYAIVGASLQLLPAPDGPYDLEIAYFQQPPALSAAAPTNWLLAAFPDLYLYGALAHAAAFLPDDRRLASWSGLYAAALESARADATRAPYGARLTTRPTLAV